MPGRSEQRLGVLTTINPAAATIRGRVFHVAGQPSIGSTVGTGRLIRTGPVDATYNSAMITRVQPSPHPLGRDAGDAV
jgi:hypothetical protein